MRPTAGSERHAVAWCLLARSERKDLPIGMLTAVPAYASPYPNEDNDLGFVWYLSDAPIELYAQRQIPQASGVASALLDIAIQTRLDLLGDAAIFLHADPAGGAKLIRYYEDKCLMTRLWHDKRISPVRSIKAGEYFAMTHDQAMRFAKKFDRLRIV